VKLLFQNAAVKTFRARTVSAVAKRTGKQVVLTDPRAIKALAHPARLAVIDELFAGRELTATECAQIAGLSPSAMSYHLRALEKWGIVESAAASNDGRERPWRAAGERLTIDSAEPHASAAAESAMATRLLDHARRDLLDWLARDDRDRDGWRDITTLSGGGRWLTDDEAEELAAAFTELLEKYPRASTSERPPGARRVRVTFVMVPTD
jgi:DNA-binding transcriptional ArsR family regulator